MLTKRHFIMIANAIRLARTELPDDANPHTVSLFIANHLAREFRRDNPKFNSATFLAACEFDI